MSRPDWIVLGVTLLAIIAYGLYKGRTSRNLDGYFLSNRTVPWYMVLLGIMGTQASAVTFLSGPGQAYTDGMRFVQFYFAIVTLRQQPIQIILLQLQPPPLLALILTQLLILSFMTGEAGIRNHDIRKSM